MSDAARLSEIKSGLDIRGLSPDRIRVSIIEDGQIAKHIVCDAAKAGAAAVLLLQCAFETSKHLIAQVPARYGYAGGVVPVSLLALEENDSPLYQTLVLRMGTAAIGFAVPNESLAELGRAFLTASASVRHHN